MMSCGDTYKFSNNNKCITTTLKFKAMNGFFKTLLAGYGAKKLGGGCFGTIIIFIIIYWILGYF